MKYIKNKKKSKSKTIRIRKKSRFSRKRYTIVIQRGGVNIADFQNIIQEFNSGTATEETVKNLVNFFIDCADNDKGCSDVILPELKKARVLLQQKRDTNVYNNIVADALNIIIAYETVIEYWAPIYDNIEFFPFSINNCPNQLEKNKIRSFYKGLPSTDYYCQIFAYFTFIANLIKDDYTLMLKGSKSIQLQLNNRCANYTSDDVDLLVYYNKEPGNIEKEKDIAVKISHLMLWLALKKDTYPLITMVNDESKIAKVSLRQGRHITALSDISYGFNNIDEKLKKFYLTDVLIQKPVQLKIHYISSMNPEKQINGLFIYQPLKYLLYEKMYYLDKYVNTSDIGKNSYFLNRSIHHMNILILCIYNDRDNTIMKELQAEQRDPGLVEFFQNSFQQFLPRLNINSKQSNPKAIEILKVCYQIIAFLYIGFNNQIQGQYQDLQMKTKKVLLENIYSLINH